jgi:hypothetical protein
LLDRRGHSFAMTPFAWETVGDHGVLADARAVPAIHEQAELVDGELI